jgi:hypothetical protein
VPGLELREHGGVLRLTLPTERGHDLSFHHSIAAYNTSPDYGDFPANPSLLDLDGLIVCPTCGKRFWTGSGHAEM